MPPQLRRLLSTMDSMVKRIRVKSQVENRKRALNSVPLVKLHKILKHQTINIIKQFQIFNRNNNLISLFLLILSKLSSLHRKKQ